MDITRRRFLRAAAAAGAGFAAGRPAIAAQLVDRPPVERPGRPGVRPRLSDTFGDLSRHFVFEYYPWYATSPWMHWNEAGRNPPVDIASNYVPALGAYDSGATAVIEQHARWIAEAGVGAINISWWGRGSDVDRRVPAIMDVMSAHGIQVTFHIEPYSDTHAYSYADDVAYLIGKYGDARHWDCFLLLEDAAGRTGPVFKSFRTILPATSTDCHGVTTPVADYTADGTWRQQTDRVRQVFRSAFDRVTLLADSLDIVRTSAGGFDGIAIYDNFVEPESWLGHAQDCTARSLLFSFNINPGFDGILLRNVDPAACYAPLPFEPRGGPYDWSREADRTAAAGASAARIRQAFGTTIALQTNTRLYNERQGFFLAYVNSFNEWHEGHAFEPMKGWSELSAAEKAIGYHNPDDGRYRLKQLADLIGAL